MKIKFLILFFIFSSYLNSVNAEEDCIFEKYIKVEGNGVCRVDCLEQIVYSKGINDISITQLRQNVRIWFRPVEGSKIEPFSAVRIGEFNPINIIQPTPNNFGYYYWVASVGEFQKTFGIRVLSYEYFNLCQNQEINFSTNRPQPPRNTEVSNINVNIVDNKGSITVGNIGQNNRNLQNINQSSSDKINFIKDIIIPILIGIIILAIWRFIVHKYFLPKRKIKKSKS